MLMVGRGWLGHPPLRNIDEKDLIAIKNVNLNYTPFFMMLDFDPPFSDPRHGPGLYVKCLFVCYPTLQNQRRIALVN